MGLIVFGGMIATFANAGTAIAPKTPSFEVELPTISENTLIAHSMPLISDFGAWEVEYAIKRVLASQGANKQEETTMLSLAWCENSFRENCIPDTNNKLSCGAFMFQETTFQQFCKGEWGNTKDQTRCALDMHRKGLTPVHWVNCSKKI